jgi:hypothetical protein
MHVLSIFVKEYFATGAWCYFHTSYHIPSVMHQFSCYTTALLLLALWYILNPVTRVVPVLVFLIKIALVTHNILFICQRDKKISSVGEGVETKRILAHYW